MSRYAVMASAILCSVIPAGAAQTVHSIEVRIVPPQPVMAITIRSGEWTQAVPVRNGKATVPADIPLPWSLGLARFEADVYTRADLDQKRPWTIRELGVLSGKVERRPPIKAERFVWLLLKGGSNELREEVFTADEDGAFALRLPAGTYQGAVLGSASGTRIRSGIVVQPGERTDIGVVPAEAAVPVSFRVVGADGRSGIAGARLIWDPPGEMINSALSRRIYARRWSAVTDRRGMAEIRPFGPLPHSARWTVETEGFARGRTAAVLLKEPNRFTMPDVQLRPRPSVVVRVQFPREAAAELENASLVAGEQRDPRREDFVAVHRVGLREGESRLTFTSYGRKRIWVESAARKKRAWEGGERHKILMQDIEVAAPSTEVQLVLRPVEISGRVTQREKPVAGSLVVLAHPRAGSDFLAESESDEDGAFRFTTWATGKMSLYTIGPMMGPGKRRGHANADLDLTGRSEVYVDLEIPRSGFAVSVVDAEGGAPIRAKLDIRSLFKDGGTSMGMEETDAEGRFELSGSREGTATVGVTAKGYRATVVEIAMRSDAPEATVRLERAQSMSGRVIDIRGMAIAHARISGGYRGEEFEPLYVTSADASGRFRFDSPPPPAVVFYVTAGGYALGTTTFAPDQEAVVTLHPPSSSIVTLRQDNRPPEKVFLVMAAPAGQGFIPMIVLEDLAEANGMSLYQLAGSSINGEVVLPEFLAPGMYDLFLARRGGKRFVYQRVGAIRTPLNRNMILAVASP